MSAGSPVVLLTAPRGATGRPMRFPTTATTEPRRIEKHLMPSVSTRRDASMPETGPTEKLELLHEVAHELISILDRDQLLERVAEVIKTSETAQLQ